MIIASHFGIDRTTAYGRTGKQSQQSVSQATASLLTEQMTGTPVADVLEWDSETPENLAGMGLTPSRLKCAELALVAFRQAVQDRT